jgi:predicted ArsR family transcriptional regulator
MSDSQWVKTWKENASAFDRVRSVAMTVSEPQTAARIAEHAQVAETTARDHLLRLAEIGMLVTDETNGATTYRPDPAYIRFRELRELVSQHSNAELAEFAADVKEALETLQADHNVDSPQALREKAIAADISATETRDLLQAASDWEHYIYRLSLLEEAVERYNEYTGQPSVASS